MISVLLRGYTGLSERSSRSRACIPNAHRMYRTTVVNGVAGVGVGWSGLDQHHANVLRKNKNNELGAPRGLSGFRA